MGDILAQLLGPDSSLLGRAIAFVVLAAIVIFYLMANASLNDRRDSERARREAREADLRAEGIAAAARRELAEKDRAAE